MDSCLVRMKSQALRLKKSPTRATGRDSSSKSPKVSVDGPTEAPCNPEIDFLAVPFPARASKSHGAAGASVTPCPGLPAGRRAGRAREAGRPAVPRPEVGGAVAPTSSPLAPRGEAECSTPDSGGSVGAARAAVPDPRHRSRPAREPGKGRGGPGRREGAPPEERRDRGLRGPGQRGCGRPGLGGRLASARARCPGVPQPPEPAVPGAAAPCRWTEDSTGKSGPIPPGSRCPEEPGLAQPTAIAGSLRRLPFPDTVSFRGRTRGGRGARGICPGLGG